LLSQDQISGIKRELIFQTSRSGGKGGQNVNKVETKVEIYFNIADSYVLSPSQKETLLKKLESKLSEGGVLRLTESKYRSQLQNKEAVLDKLTGLLSKALIKPKLRRATKPSKASKRRKAETKKKRSEVKQWRKKIV